MGRAGSRSAGPLPRQSRPYVLANPSSALRKTDDDEDDDRLPFKMACGSFFTWHLKNAFCARKKTTDRRSLYEDEEDEDSSSGTDIIDEVILLCCSLSLILSPKPKSQIYLTEKKRSKHNFNRVFSCNVLGCFSCHLHKIELMRKLQITSQ